MQGFSKWGNYVASATSYMVCIKGGPPGRAVWVELFDHVWFAASAESGFRVPVAAFVTEDKAKEYVRMHYAMADGFNPQASSMALDSMSWKTQPRIEDDPEVSDRQAALVWDPFESGMLIRERRLMPAYWEVWKLRLSTEKPVEEEKENGK